MSGFPAGYGRLVFGEVTSTLDVARAEAGGLAGPTWILAERQTAARGRRGRPWAGAPGNFMASLVLPVQAVGTAALRSFVAALAVRDALVAACGRETDITLKWPNDVLLRGQKVSGILLETISAGGAISHLAIGIGVNLADAPPAARLPEGALPAIPLKGAYGLEIAPEAFLDHVADAFARWDAQMTTYGFEPIRTAWCAQAARLGEVITARTTHDEIRGTFRDVDERGQLVLETQDGRVAIPAADVFF